MKLLIVDDEIYTREGLRESIDWKKIGIDEVMAAKDGLEALDISGWYQPEIVLTDIKMPQLDGTAFAEKFLKRFPDSKLLFISAYMDAQYLKKAIRLSAVDFIEKPILLDEVEKAVQKCVKSIQEQKRVERDTAKANELKKEKLVFLLKSKHTDMAAAFCLCEEIGFPKDGLYVVFYYRWPFESGNQSESEYLCKKIEEFWERKHMDAVTARLEKGEYLSVIHFSSCKEKELDGYAKEFLRKEPGSRIGIGFEVDQLVRAAESYQTAVLAMEKSFYKPKQGLYRLDESLIVPPQSLDPNIYSNFYDLMKKTPFKLMAYIDVIFADFSKNQYLKKEHIQMMTTSILETVFKNRPDLKWKMKEEHRDEDTESLVCSCDNIDELKQLLKYYVALYIRDNPIETSFSPVIAATMEYIMAHCTESELSLTEIADHFHLSVGYLMMYFKQETKQTIRQYIETCRIELAKQKLAGSHMRIGEIAHTCGFSTSNYFARVFRELEGITPMEYRQLKRE